MTVMLAATTTALVLQMMVFAKIVIPIVLLAVRFVMNNVYGVKLIACSGEYRGRGRGGRGGRGGRRGSAGHGDRQDKTGLAYALHFLRF